ncbi:ABC transporter permease [Noviherbaspirillum cavernae]|uniref:ABC transporter permease n=1 Tax=Noviherbaspirillum cavernae TaxID=2320862 RepID=A0A418X3U4_9BURK|nr:ABC transporter permease [Noviherbaspirillum cavernae]RJG07096.1 ABC transporter permease [Noviherbaspirillum cavernae]
MNMYSFLGALESGLLFGLVALGTLLTFRILNFPDITVEGSFPLGAAVAATLISHDINPFVATGCAALAGAAAGSITIYMNVRLRILHILAGILVSVALYSVNLRVMGRPNTPLLGQDTVFSFLSHLPLPSEWAVPVALLVGMTVLVLLLNRFLQSEVGLAMRATGANERMAAANGVNTDRMKWLGLALGNALVAVGGALFAQTQGAADVNMGVGVIVIGFAAVIGGAALMPQRTMLLALISAVIGAVVYKLIVSLALSFDGFGITPSDLNIVTALLVAFALVAPDTKLFKRGRSRTALKKVQS